MLGVGLGLTAAAAAHSGVYSPPVEAILRLNLSGLAVGNLDNTRASTATVVDNYGVTNTAKVGESRQQGARRVEQLLTHTEDFANAAWARSAGGTGTVATKTPNFGTAPDGTTTACRVVLNKGAGDTANDRSFMFQTFSAISNARGSLYIKSSTASSFTIAIGTNNLLTTLTVDNTWRRYTHELDTGSATQLQIELRGGLGHSQTADLLIWHPMMENMTSRSITAPSDYIHSGTEYNATCLGVRYYSTSNGNTVSANVVSELAGGNLSPAPYYLLEPAATNFFLNSNAPATQTIALTAGQYTIAVVGTGSIALTGGSTGTVTASAPLTFTTSGSVTFTVSGSVTRAQVESGPRATSHIPTTVSAASRSADVMTTPLVNNTNFIQNSGLLLLHYMPLYNSVETSSTPILSIGSITHTHATGYAVSDGTNVVYSAPSGVVSGDDVILAVIWDFDETVMAVNHSRDGGATWLSWHSETYDGAFPLPANYEWFSANGFTNRLFACRVYNTVGKTLAQMQAWVPLNAAAEMT